MDAPFIKGQSVPIKNCWHFSTDGNSVDVLFYGDDDFIAAMNRIYVVVGVYKVVILAFSLMDTHVHFVLYGEFDECNRFMHEYVRRTSIHLARIQGRHNSLKDVPIHHQAVDNDLYLKTVICYVVKNAPVGGISYNAVDYPWSSGPLYFRSEGNWASPRWTVENLRLSDTLSARQRRQVFGLRESIYSSSVKMIGRLIFPGEYVAYELVEAIYRTHKGYNYFLCRSKEEDVESRGGFVSRLSIPIQEMRVIKKQVCKELFGQDNTKNLNTGQRLRLARTLKSRYNSSPKQIAKLSGLIYEEVKNLL